MVLLPDVSEDFAAHALLAGFPVGHYAAGGGYDGDAQTAQTNAGKVKTGAEASYVAMQVAEVIATVPEVAPVADKVMQNAGYQAPTPEGVDPNFPTVAGDTLSGAGVTAIQSGATEAAQQDVIPDPASTSPMLPAPAGQGAAQGIETQRADGVRP